jgi:hypothetical protein
VFGSELSLPQMSVGFLFFANENDETIRRPVVVGDLWNTGL